ncbi:MAG: NlpC/P60 family protein [Clostridiales bacterium]|nr:NlpC/P60 family protein [Clostridiales bacterium]
MKENTQRVMYQNEKEREILMGIVKKIILSVMALTAITTTTALAADLSGWAVSEYQSANRAGLVSYSVVSHNLKDDISREEFCELTMNLYKKLTNEELIVPVSSPFTDTNSVAVAQAYCYGIVSGTDDGTFTPDRLVTREEMAKMLVSTLAASEVDFALADGSDKSAIANFTDAGQISPWAEASVITALDNAFLNGVDDYTLNPLGSASREQAIASVNRVYNNFAASSYSVELPVVTLPENGSEIEEGDFTISWTPVPAASSYHVIIKDANADSVVLENIYSTTEHTISEGTLHGTKEYTLVVGGVLADGSEVYSMPVDFTYVKKSASSYLTSNPKAQAILDTAAQYLGVPYLWGGTTPSGFDCSGFVQYVFAQNGISLTRTTYTQWDNDGSYVSIDNLQPGDLVYFGSSRAPHHVGIYVGNDTYIHAPSTGKTIQYSSLSSRRDCCGGKRVF